MTDITPNHLHIYRDRRGKHITLDGQDLLLDGEDPMLITGMENPAEVTRVMLTLLAPKITVDSEIEDREPEPATVDAPEPTLAEELRDTARWWREGAPTWEQCCDRFESLAARAEQIEQERDDASAEVERITAEHVTDPSPTLNDPSMTRLVPAPRVITNHDEAWNLPIRTIIRDSRGETFERTEDGWGRISVPVKAIKWPVTVLWEPEVAK